MRAGTSADGLATPGDLADAGTDAGTPRDDRPDATGRTPGRRERAREQAGSGFGQAALARASYSSSVSCTWAAATFSSR